MQSPALRLLLLSEHASDHQRLCDALIQAGRIKQEGTVYQVHWVADPAQAISALHDGSLHLCLLDEGFAGDAADFLRAVQGNHLPPLLVRTYDRADYSEPMREALEAWAGYVCKALEAEE